ncbi:hypothetical protein V8J82_04520 [Gymnodinialimonas sp. 2305UL16-5]|uniref:hypothetical protein n=1 Tax=Gymnodinialimonas mytili TaxID=3126503 RepID=UPI0030B0ED37
MTAAPLRIFMTLLLMALDVGAGLIIGGFTSMLVLFLFTDTGFAWIFGGALILAIISTGVADRFLLPKRSSALRDTNHRNRRIAFILGLALGAFTPVIRLGILPGALAP